MTVQQQAIRAFRRIWTPRAESYALGAYLDAKFDCGEFSGAANVTAEQQEFYETMQRVALRFGITAQDLDSAILAAGYHEFDCMMESRSERRFIRAPVQITAERFDEMLNVLPPSDWRGSQGRQSFKMCERTFADITAIFLRGRRTVLRAIGLLPHKP